MTEHPSPWKSAVLASGLCLLGLAATAVRAQETAVVRERRILAGPYSLGLTTNGVTVAWQTMRPRAGAVRYRRADAPPRTWTEVASASEGPFHLVRLAGLEPGTEYQAEALADGMRIGGLAFRTAPAVAEDFTFFAYGDSHDEPARHRLIANGVLAEAARLGQRTFVLHAGDLAALNVGEEKMARQFFRPAARMLARLPVAAVKGNHDNANPQLFRRYFPPMGEATGSPIGETYCFDYGPVRLIVLDPYLPVPVLEVQKNWLADRLAEAKDRWRLVSMHEPLYTSGEHGPAMAARDRIESVMVAGKVHAVFSGHDHNYERTFPINGITYFTTGGGGAHLRGRRSEEDDNTWSARFETTLHFLTVEVRPDKLTVKALRPVAGGGFETFDTGEVSWESDWPENLPAPSSPVATESAVEP